MKKLFAAVSTIAVLQGLPAWAVQPGEPAPDFKAETATFMSADPVT